MSTQNDYLAIYREFIEQGYSPDEAALKTIRVIEKDAEEQYPELHRAKKG